MNQTQAVAVHKDQRGQEGGGAKLIEVNNQSLILQPNGINY